MSDKAIRRPDLEAIECAFPVDYVTNKVLPFYGVSQSTGKLFYQDFNADVSAQYARTTGNLSAITSNTVAAANVVFSTNEIIARVKAGYDQVAGMGGLDAAEIALARVAKRSYYNKIEALTAAALLNDNNATDGHSDVVGTIDTAVAGLRDKGIGKVGIVMSWHNFAALKADTTVKARMQMTGNSALGNNRFVPAEAMAEVFGADEVILGGDSIWYASTLTGKDCIAVVVLPDEAYTPAEQVQLGRTICFEFNGEDYKSCIETWFDNSVKANVVDCFGEIDQQVLNSELKKTISLVALSE